MSVVFANPQEKTFVKESLPLRPILRRPRTRQAFLGWNPRDGFKYEWDNGNILKLPKMITDKQAHIVDNLLRFFAKTKAYTNGDSLLPELKSLTIEEQVRVPDIAYVTYDERYKMSQGETPTPAFAIEIISPTDSYNRVDLKLEEYFKAGVKVLWHIVPETEKIYVFTSPENITVCRGNSLCSAESIVAGFSISANEIFQKPLPPQ